MGGRGPGLPWTRSRADRDLQGLRGEHRWLLVRGQRGGAIEPVDIAVVMHVAASQQVVAGLALRAGEVPELSPGAGGGLHAAAVLGADGVVGSERGVPVEVAGGALR